jgi:hypothetical protein
MKQEIKRYLVSSLVTFIAVFLLTILPYVSEVTLESLKGGAFLSLMITAARAGVKAAIEILIPYIQSLIK